MILNEKDRIFLCNELRNGVRAREVGCTLTSMSNRESEVDRLIGIGATRYPWRYRPGSDFVVLEDPDGNLFCVVQAGG